MHRNAHPYTLGTRRQAHPYTHKMHGVLTHMHAIIHAVFFAPTHTNAPIHAPSIYIIAAHARTQHAQYTRTHMRAQCMNGAYMMQPHTQSSTHTLGQHAQSAPHKHASTATKGRIWSPPTPLGEFARFFEISKTTKLKSNDRQFSNFTPSNA